MGHLIIGFQEMELVYCKLRSKVEKKMIVKKSEELIANISRYDKVVVVAVAPSNQDKALELKYFLWRGKYEDSPTRFREKFYNEIKENQTVGLIDPSFHENAKEAYECFGKDLKVILMMRNPVDATYSNFKMRMRRTKHKSYVDYYKDTKVFNVEMFGKYIDHAVIGGKDERYRYTDCVEEYINYFGKENIQKNHDGIS